MKVIRPNSIKLGKLDPNAKISDARSNLTHLIQIKDEHVQFVESESTGSDIMECNMHPLVQAVHEAYSSHLALVLSPDMIWYCIASATATHINLNSEALRDKFVEFEGKKKLEIRRDDFVLGSMANPWHEVVGEFCTKIGENTKNGISEKMTANFSTTSKVSKVASQIVLMDCVQKYFDFSFSTCCGIPEIRITGDKSDWEIVRSKAKEIVELIPEFEVWMKSGLNEILEHFIGVFDDKVDKDFWNEIYKVGHGSGGPYLSGWLIGLFPYLDDNVKNPYITEEKTWRNSAESHFDGLTTNDFKYHMNKVPFVWNYLGTEIEMLFVAGLVGVNVEKDGALVPVFGYAITEDKIIVKNNNN